MIFLRQTSSVGECISEDNDDIYSGGLKGGGGGGAERAEARGPATFRGPTNLHFSKSFFLAKNIFDV